MELKPFRQLKKEKCMKKIKILYGAIILSWIITGTSKPFFRKAPQKSPHPSTVRSPELRIVAKKTIEKRKVSVHNRTQKPIYVAVDCNYRTQIGGGYERRSNPRKVSIGRTDTFFIYVPKGEEIAIRWTPQNPKWFEATPMQPEEEKQFEEAKKKFAEKKEAMQKKQKESLEKREKKSLYQKLIGKKSQTWFKEEKGKKLTEEEVLAQTLTRKKDLIKAIRESDWYETDYTLDKNVSIYIYKRGLYRERPSPRIKRAHLLKFIKSQSTRRRPKRAPGAAS